MRKYQQKKFKKDMALKYKCVLQVQNKEYAFYHTLLKLIEDLIHCAGCTGFYTSIIAYYLLNWHIDKEVIAYMFVGSFSSLVLVELWRMLTRK